MNNILAVVLMDPSDIIMLPSERFIKGPANNFCSLGTLKSLNFSIDKPFVFTSSVNGKTFG